MQLSVIYQADAERIARIIGDLPDAELVRLFDMTELVPELFPKMTCVLVAAAHRGLGERS